MVVLTRAPNPPTAPAPSLDAFRQGLRDLGFNRSRINTVVVCALTSERAPAVRPFPRALSTTYHPQARDFPCPHRMPPPGSWRQGCKTYTPVAIPHQPL